VRLFRKLFPVISEVELKLLTELKSKLNSDAAKIFDLQIQQINYVRRQLNSKNIYFMNRKNGELFRDPKIKFPNCQDEVKLCTMNFVDRKSKINYKAVFWLVKGHLFELDINNNLRKIKNLDDIEIHNIIIHENPMEVKTSKEYLLKDMEALKLKGSIKEWLSDFKISETKEPLPEKDRKEIIKKLSTCFPDDYLELVEQTEGVIVNDWSIMGLSQIYEVTIKGDDFLLIADKRGEACLLLKSQSSDGEIYFQNYNESDFTPIGKFLFPKIRS